MYKREIQRSVVRGRGNDRSMRCECECEYGCASIPDRVNVVLYHTMPSLHLQDRHGDQHASMPAYQHVSSGCYASSCICSSSLDLSIISSHLISTSPKSRVVNKFQDRSTFMTYVTVDRTIRKRQFQVSGGTLKNHPKVCIRASMEIKNEDRSSGRGSAGK